MKKILKMIVWTVVTIVVLIAVVAILFLNLSPQFGGSHSEEDRARYQQSGHYQDGKFKNLVPTSMNMNAGDMLSALKKFIEGVPNQRPGAELPVEPIDSSRIAEAPPTDRLYWFGHSAFLLQLEGKTLLLDPMLGDVPSPHPWLGRGRYSKTLPIRIEQLTQVDAVVISHDHYDHLDYVSIQALIPKTKKFFVPLGVGAHLEAWGVDPEAIEELNWWDETKYEGIKLVFTPSRHFSGRGLTDRWATLWGSWVIESPRQRLYFSGDSGYSPHFREIGEKYGPFDFAMIECGQYNERWANIHMMPEESAQAAVDLQAKLMMPIHWGAFTLALHSWTDPVERVTRKAEHLSMPYIIPKIGEEVRLDSAVVENSQWWESL